jgi:hypothetical protein
MLEAAVGGDAARGKKKKKKTRMKRHDYKQTSQRIGISLGENREGRQCVLVVVQDDDDEGG